ncbi:ADYC domain-containing protein [Nannocystis bainbridge]|uniref:ADYC domain-containing protein n=1 Tax=Nannocystis bainbridge TaxID=2995303 RepID=A0ABT5DXC0_9BACT|nr:ADYC domain-containing protein [Nannocystis bainbridge]MDC0717759.1 ADYC domain-containing protein [Nannocystis bainbridge]
MSRTQLLLALALSLSAASACDEALDDEFGAPGDVDFRPGGFGNGGLLLNTSAIGDHLLHEINRKGEKHEDVQLLGVYLKIMYKDQVTWLKLDEQWSEKGQLYGRVKGTVYKGKDFTGSRWELATFGGGLGKRTMYVHSYRFDSADQNHKYVFAYPKDPAYGMHFYTKKYQSIKNTSLLAACGDLNGEGLEAVVYEGLHVDMDDGYVDHKEDLINIACLDGGIGKAALWGYRPWDIGYYEFMGAIRTIRADYCGDGDSWTKSGTAIDLEDKWGIHNFANSTLKTEAIFGPKGAACVTRPRRPEFQLTGVECNGAALPDCKSSDLDDFSDGLFWTKAP